MTLPAMHPAKRRRLDQSTSTLSKPFRSPLRVDVNKHSQPDGPPESDEQKHNDKLQKIHPHQHSDKHSDKLSQTLPATTKSRSASSPLAKTPSLQPPSTSSPIRPQAPILSSSPTRTTLTRTTRSPEYLALQKQHSRLLLQLSTLRKSLDTAQQALKIESSSQSTELDALVLKWRNIAREAAEELFRGAKDRVNKMGGLGAWRERTQKRDEVWGGDQNDNTVGFGMEAQVDEEELSEEQRELLNGYRDEIKRERERYGKPEREKHAEDEEKKREREKAKDEESFTMDMMLKQLNIELDIIGYDATEQRWID